MKVNDMNDNHITVKCIGIFKLVALSLNFMLVKIRINTFEI